MRVLLLFFDGWGLGANDPATNPFLTAPMPTLRALCDGAMPTRESTLRSARAMVVPTDATLGVAGLPQSATGQTTLLTGINAPRALGAHVGPYPNDSLRALLTRDNLLMRLTASGHRVAFANAYPPIFFERLARDKARRSATSYAVQAAGVRYRDIDDLRAGNAVSAFVTNHIWREHGADVPLITARQAGANLARLAAENDFTLFEYFLTDAAGHKANAAFTTRVLAEVDELLGGVLEASDLNDTLIVITSDHGNIEDTTTRAHTRNPVPTMLIGAAREHLAPRVHTLADLAPALTDVLLRG
ncbi:MAG: alkaline phosphatase family protein [Anaerolineae bacterium]|nr:alkaline phosphatase family protein [Anaerolineae bacterium]